ncbi:MogA/MoaB family molybdenum cofactor biosynthesis protein [Haloarcula sp. GH36]|uniref:MogA/MoaB family molybdenum cofactor biosynthesis protein n=1 Tax=Haloarcula montana TaxID=3111776 RepID=UPI002D79C092|nr:molybdopterin-binding protein [Haloarcula sp. GH36]
MVDFQSRDTRRGASEQSDDEPETDPDQETEPPGDDGTNETGTANEAETADGTEIADETDTVDGTDTRTTEADAASRTETADEAEKTAPASDMEPAESPGSPPESASADTQEPAETTPAGSKPTSSEPVATAQTAQSVSMTPTRSIDVALVAVGEAATSEDDPNPTADRLTESLTDAGHSVTVTRELSGGYDEVQGAVDGLVSRPDVEAVVTVGGTGIAQSEVVIEAVHPLFEKVLPGFGEVVRNLLFYRAGTSVVGVRTTAGIAGGSPVFCLPGERELAVRAVEEVVTTEAPALVAELE